MSTRSRIGFINAGESVATTCYAHWDGYVEYMGRMLKLYYTSPIKVKELVSAGDLSSIGKFVGTKHDFDNCPVNECNYYGRDREEHGREAVQMDTAKFWGDSLEEYNYLFNMENGKWYWRSYCKNNWKELTFDDCEITIEERKQAYKELKEHEKNQHKNLDEMLDNFLALSNIIC